MTHHATCPYCQHSFLVERSQLIGKRKQSARCGACGEAVAVKRVRKSK